MAGTFRGDFYSNRSDSDRISEELYDAFNIDEYDDRGSRRKGRQPAHEQAPRRKGSSAPAKRRKRKKDRQMIAMVGFAVLGFLLVAEILCGIFIWDFPALATIAVLVMSLLIGIILGPGIIVAPILIVAVEVAAGIFAGHALLAILGAVLLIGGQAFCFALK